MANLTVGSRGPYVTALQTALNNQLQAPAASITVDGIFGPQTKAAVIIFQGQQGLTQDGIVGPRTAAALGIDLPADTGGSSSSGGQPAPSGTPSAGMSSKTKLWVGLGVVAALGYVLFGKK